jgi:hypothetical protein
VLFSPGWRAPVRQGVVLAVFTLGLLLGGTLSATAVWSLSGFAAPIPPYGRVWAIVGVALLGVLREAGLVRLRLPQNARQIPQDVLQRRLLLGTLQFGFELGTGVRTFVSASAPYVLALGLLLSHQGFPATVVVGTAFGLGRSLTAALTLWSRDADRDLTIAVRMPWVTTITATVALIALALLLLA